MIGPALKHIGFSIIYGKSRNMLFWLLLLHVIYMPGPLFSLNQDLINCVQVQQLHDEYYKARH